MKISFTDFSAPIGASVFKFCVHLQVGKVYCVEPAHVRELPDYGLVCLLMKI